MAEYISREKAIKELREVYENEYPTASGDFDEYASHDVPNVLRNIKVADVQPIRHGRWIDCTFYDPCEKSWEQNYEFKCSNCGHKIYNKPNDNNLFCGHCSARMDGDTE